MQASSELQATKKELKLVQEKYEVSEFRVVELGQCDTELAEMTSKYEKLKSVSGELEQTLTDLSNSYDFLQREHAKLENQLDKLKSTKQDLEYRKWGEWV